MAVPWGVLVSALPVLVESAGKLFNKAGEPPPRYTETSGGGTDDHVRALERRMDYFENLEAEQAKLLKQIIEQMQQMAIKSAAMEKRANLAVGVAAVSAVLAVIALVAGLR